MKRTFVLLAATVVATAICAQAQSPVLPGGALSLETCLDIALANNPSLKASKFAFAASNELEGSARSAYFPSLNLQGGYRRWESHAFLPNFIYNLPFGRISPVIGPTNQYSVDVEGSYTIFDGGFRKARLDAASARKTAASFDAARSRDEIVLSVTTAFYSLAASRSGLAVANESAERGEDHLKLAEERKAVGAVPLADVLRARVNLANAKLAVVHARSQTSVAEGALAEAMGLSPETPLDITPVIADVNAPPDIDVSKSFAEAEEARPEMKAALGQVAAAKAMVRAAESAYSPKVDLDGTYGRMDSGFFPYDKDWSVGVMVRLPLFTGFERGHEIERAKAELGRAQELRNQQSLNVRQEVWDAYAGAQEAANAVLAVKALVADAAESLRMAEERYKAGAGTITDFLDAETNLSSAQSREVQAVFQCCAAGAALKRAMGQLYRAPEVRRSVRGQGVGGEVKR